MSGVSESTPPPAVPTLAAPNSPAQTQTQSPPAVTDTPAAASQTPVESLQTPEAPLLTPAVTGTPAAASQTPVEPLPTPEAPLLTPAVSQLQSDDQMPIADTAGGSADAVVGFGAITSLPPAPVSIPPGAIILRHMGNTGSTWMKRKRGQPRYFALFTPVQAQAQVQVQVQVQAQAQPQPQTVPPPPPSVHPESQSPVVDLASPPAKKARTRPPSSNKKQKKEALGSPGVNFIPHVIDVEAGEDVASKIIAFSQNGPRDVCILSVSGSISNVTIREPATSGGTATYEGWYDIVALSGSFVLSKDSSQKKRTGGLSILFAGPDGMVIGGSVAGLLVAASPVQVVMGSYDEEESKEMKSAQFSEPSFAPPKFNNGGDAGANSSQLHGTLGESSRGAASLHNPSSASGTFNNNPQFQ